MIDKQLLEKALYLYHNDMNRSVISICEEVGFSPQTLYYHLDYKEPLRENRKHKDYTLDLTNFYQDSHSKYYWLGFLAADGYISSTAVRVHLKAQDAKHLQSLLDFVKSNSPLKFCKNNGGHDTVYIDIHSVKLVKYLAQYNLVSNESLIYTVPDNIPNEYLMDFCRGMIDGDGCIRINNHQQISLKFDSGNETCAYQVRDILGLDNKISFSGGTYGFQVTGNKKAKAVLDKLYENSNETNRLKRKYDIYYNKFYLGE